MGGGGHFISYSGRVFTATPDDDMERVYEENQNETGFEFVHGQFLVRWHIVTTISKFNSTARKLPIQNVWENHSSIEVAQRK